VSVYKRKPSTGPVYEFKASAWDRFDRKDNTPADGTLVRKTQPAGCPKNGTLGHCFVEDLDGKFIGLVATASLVRVKKADLHDKKMMVLAAKWSEQDKESK
jgi:hypothetical protein